MFKILPIIALFLFSISFGIPSTLARTCTENGLCSADVDVLFSKAGGSFAGTLNNVGKTEQFNLRFYIENTGELELPASFNYEIKLPSEITNAGSTPLVGTVPSIPACTEGSEAEATCYHIVDIKVQAVSSLITDGECVDVMGIYKEVTAPAYDYQVEDTGRVCFASASSNNNNGDDNEDDEDTTTTTSATGQIAEVPDTGSEQLFYGVFSVLLMIAGVLAISKNFLHIKTAKSKIVKSILES